MLRFIHGAFGAKTVIWIYCRDSLKWFWSWFTTAKSDNLKIHNELKMRIFLFASKLKRSKSGSRYTIWSWLIYCIASKRKQLQVAERVIPDVVTKTVVAVLTDILHIRDLKSVHRSLWFGLKLLPRLSCCRDAVKSGAVKSKNFTIHSFTRNA